MILYKPKRIFLSAAAALFAASLATQADAFCFTNRMFSTKDVYVTQLTWGQYNQIAKNKKCDQIKSEGEDESLAGMKKLGCRIDADTKESFKSLWRDITGNARFSAQIKPGKTQCCSYKDKSCNPGLKKSGEVVFLITSLNSKGSMSNFYLDSMSKPTVYRTRATAHLLCDINENYGSAAPDCRTHSSPWAFKNSGGGMLIQSLHSEKCLDVFRNNKSNGANVGLWKCHGGKNQRWTFHQEGYIRSALNGKCLDVKGATKAARNGANVIMWDCHGGKNQAWRYSSNGKVVSDAPGAGPWCLDIKGGKKSNGANAQIWKCHNKSQVRWLVTETPVLINTLQVRHGGKCLDNTGKKSKGARVHSWACNASNVNQQWLLKKRGGGYYEIKSGRSGLCLDVAGNSKGDGAKVHQWPCNGGKNQQWIFIAAGDGWFRIRARHSNKCLDLEGPRKDDGTPFRQWACQNASGQAFKLLD